MSPQLTNQSYCSLNAILEPAVGGHCVYVYVLCLCSMKRPRGALVLSFDHDIRQDAWTPYIISAHAFCHDDVGEANCLAEFRLRIKSSHWCQIG